MIVSRLRWISFWARALFQLDSLTSDPVDREHVSYGLYRPEAGDRWKPRFVRHCSCAGAEDLLVTLDYAEDYALIRAAHEALGQSNQLFGAAELIPWIRAHPELHDPCRAVRGLISP